MVLSCLIGLSNGFGAGFNDKRENGDLDGWRPHGGREWVEEQGLAQLREGNEEGFLINDCLNANNGTLEVDVNSDQWQGDDGGVVFRYTSPTEYFVLPFSKNKSEY